MAKTRQQHRIGLIIFVVIAAATCLLLGYWQLSRFESSTGTAQNLGYAFQWPAFAAFFIYAYRRFIRLEADREAELDAEEAAAGETTPGLPVDVEEIPTASAARKRVWVDRDKTKMTEIPEYLLPQRAASARAGQGNTATSAGSGNTGAGDTGSSRTSTDSTSKSLNEYNDYLTRLTERDTEGHRR